MKPRHKMDYDGILEGKGCKASADFTIRRGIPQSDAKAVI